MSPKLTSLAIQILLTNIICGLNLKYFSMIFFIGKYIKFADSQWLILIFLKCNKNLSHIQIQFSSSSLHWQPTRFLKIEVFLPKNCYKIHRKSPCKDPKWYEAYTPLLVHYITSVNEGDEGLSCSGESSAWLRRATSSMDQVSIDLFGTWNTSLLSCPFSLRLLCDMFQQGAYYKPDGCSNCYRFTSPSPFCSGIL